MYTCKMRNWQVLDPTTNYLQLLELILSRINRWLCMLITLRITLAYRNLNIINIS